MGRAALDAASSVAYEGAGTVEFLYTDSGGKPEFFFLEMNTRLQVEHPVTEYVTGIDLVREQLYVTAGEKLRWKQEDIELRGHSIEIRLNAEDPSRGFVPSTGTIKNLRFPGGPWVRVDSGLFRGMEVGLNYDPMLAKIIVWGPDRDAAIARMRRALAEMNIGGVRTSAPAALAVLEDERFQSGRFDTHLLETVPLLDQSEEGLRAAAIAATIQRFKEARRRALAAGRGERQGWAARGRELSDGWGGRIELTEERL